VNKRRIVWIMGAILFFSSATVPAFATYQDYYAGGGANDGLSTEIYWRAVDDTNLVINDIIFINGGRSDSLDGFGTVWVRIGGVWYSVNDSTPVVGDLSSSTFTISISENISGITVDATLSITDNRAKWSVSTSAPVQQIIVSGNLGSDGSEIWYRPSVSDTVWWSNDNGTDSGSDPLLRFETTTGGTLRQSFTLTDGASGSDNANSSDLRDRSSDQIIALSSSDVSEFFLCLSVFNYNSSSGFDDVTARNSYIDGLSVERCGTSSGPGAAGAAGFPWVGDQNITCPNPNPWVNEQLGFASNVKPVLVSAENTIGKTITQGSYDALKFSGVVFDTVSTKVSTATETLPIYGCKDKLLSGKVNQPIQFIAGGYTLQSDAHGYINTADLKWHDTNGVTLYTNTAVFMHTIKFTKTGKYVVVLTEQPDTSRGLIPTYGVRSIRFVININ
jgi:hypothetical protein